MEEDDDCDQNLNPSPQKDQMTNYVTRHMVNFLEGL
jgi:hypothetical protein